MGERRLVALLKELTSLNWACLFYKHFTATRFFRQTPPRARNDPGNPYPALKCWAITGRPLRGLS